MNLIKESNDVEFVVAYGDGSSHHVEEGVLLEVTSDEVIFHNGTNRVSVLFASIEALLKVVDLLGLMPMLAVYLEHPLPSGYIQLRRQSFSAEKQACFRLGQKDMQESVVLMLTEAANSTYGITSSALRIAVDKVKELEV